ncbi:TRAFs-binding domain-containing protein [Cohnella suwonensis]|uniref:TRAFs-binding domain-containing protein n=1 Tax=Cohnella suwonensis TaxID=696072 RepID=A0ABW0LW88_9BACL
MLKVFISHSHDEKDLALAWQTLLDHVSQGAIEVWLSSDTKPSGGMKIGAEWRDNIYEKLSAADYVIAIISPRSIERPWILWECGVASGTNKDRGLIPVVYSMPLSDFEGPLSSYQAYPGEDKERIIEICERLMVEAKLQPKKQYWEQQVETYLSTVRLHKPPRNVGTAAISVWLRRIESLISIGRISELGSLVDSMYSSFGTDKAMDIQIHDLLSQTFIEEKKYTLALSEVQKALTLLPDDLELLHRKALILLEEGNHSEAKELLDYIYREFPDARYLPEISGLEGRLYRELFESTGRRDALDAAISAYELAYEKDPLSYYCGVNSVTLRLIAGDIKGAQEKTKAVLAVCEELAKRDTVSFWVDFTIGELYLVLGDTDRALNLYGNGLKRNPGPKDRQKESALKGVQRIFTHTRLEAGLLTRFEELLK